MRLPVAEAERTKIAVEHMATAPVMMGPPDVVESAAERAKR